MMIKTSSFFVFLFVFFQMHAQHTTLPLNHEADLIYQQEINASEIHSTFKPLIKSTVNRELNIDSLRLLEFPNRFIKWYKRKLFSEHLIVIEGKDYKVKASPIIHFSKGKETEDNINTFSNTRGFIIEGDIGKSVSFFSSFMENQAIFPNYLDEEIRKSKVVFGQGYARDFKKTGFDYAMASGYIGIKPAQHFVVQFGHGKHFIGDGYRSLLISDNSLSIFVSC